uniref:Uncharacterized protein n=1 Tax=Arundo donax TaxID=35708 RepID=A0A0A9H5C7_ARUDO
MICTIVENTASSPSLLCHEGRTRKAACFY